jgi:26S proteasome regulatory subunit N12
MVREIGSITGPPRVSSRTTQKRTFRVPRHLGLHYITALRMSNQTSDLPTLVQSLQRNFSIKIYTSLPDLLVRAKLLLSSQNLLTPTSQTPESQVNLARTVFEIGAYTSIRLKDKASFVNYLGYLQNFYSLGLGGEKEAELTGLDLLRLLAENKIDKFHTQLEIIDATAKGVATSEPVRFARGLEEWVMEGAYNRVWKAGESPGVSEYQKYFLDVLMDTIR